MTYKLAINGRLPGFNELFGAANANRHVGNHLKQQAQNAIMWHIRQQLRGVHIDKPVILHYSYWEPNRKRDKDNVSAGAHKLVQDALVKMGVILNDGWRDVQGFTDLNWDVDAKNPRVMVEIEEVTCSMEET